MTIRQDQLPNGLRIVTETMPGFETVYTNGLVCAGSRHEQSEQNGVAHFLEHMVFKGTHNRTREEIFDAIGAVGGYLNAFTSHHTTQYVSHTLKDDAALALDVISGLLLHPTLPEETIEVERSVILQEIARRKGTPDEVIFDWLQEVEFPDQAIGRSILGTEERVKKITREDLQSFKLEKYTPDKMILSVAGAVDHDMIVREAEDLFGQETPGIAVLAEDTPDFQGGEIRKIKDLEQAHFALSLRGPNAFSDDLATAWVYAKMLGGDMSSRLHKRIREELGLSYAIHAYQEYDVDYGSIWVYAETSPDKLSELSFAIVDELRRAACHIGHTEVTHAKAKVKAEFLMWLESPCSRADYLAEQVRIYGSAISVRGRVLNAVDAVGTADVQRFAETVIGTKPALVLYGPVQSAPDFETLTSRLWA